MAVFSSWNVKAAWVDLMNNMFVLDTCFFLFTFNGYVQIHVAYHRSAMFTTYSKKRFTFDLILQLLCTYITSIIVTKCTRTPSQETSQVIPPLHLNLTQPVPMSKENQNLYNPLQNLHESETLMRTYVIGENIRNQETQWKSGKNGYESEGYLVIVKQGNGSIAT